MTAINLDDSFFKNDVLVIPDLTDPDTAHIFIRTENIDFSQDPEASAWLESQGRSQLQTSIGIVLTVTEAKFDLFDVAGKDIDPRNFSRTGPGGVGARVVGSATKFVDVGFLLTDVADAPEDERLEVAVSGGVSVLGGWAATAARMSKRLLYGARPS